MPGLIEILPHHCDQFSLHLTLHPVETRWDRAILHIVAFLWAFDLSFHLLLLYLFIQISRNSGRRDIQLTLVDRCRDQNRYSNECVDPYIPYMVFDSSLLSFTLCWSIRFSHDSGVMRWQLSRSCSVIGPATGLPCLFSATGNPSDKLVSNIKCVLRTTCFCSNS